MTDEQLASLRSIGASLKTIGNAMAESFNHAGAGSATPLEPLDLRLASELPNLRREGQLDMANALLALRQSYGETNNG